MTLRVPKEHYIESQHMKTETKSPASAVIAVLLAGIFWGVINIFIKRLSAGGLDALQISLIRMTVAVIVFPVAVLIKDPSLFRIRPRDIWIFACTGIISVVLFNVCYFYTMINSQASVAVVLLYTSPIFVMLLSALFFKEKVTFRKILALVLTFVGCVLVAGLAGGNYSVPPLIFLTGIASGLFYALYSIFGNIALRKYDTMTVTVWTFLFAFVGSIPFGQIGETISAFQADPTLILWGIGIGIVSTVLPYFFYTWGLQRMETSKAAILVAIEPLVGCVIGMTVFGEPHNGLKISGIVLILAAIVILNIRFRAERNSIAAGDDLSVEGEAERNRAAVAGGAAEEKSAGTDVR